jgi:replicative DNA helicase
LGNNAINILKQNKCVVLITLEMSEQMYARRFDSQISKIKNYELNKSIPLLKSKLEDYSKIKPNAQLIIKEFPPKTITCNHIKTYIKKLISKKIKPEAIIIDYVNLINPTLITASSYENVKSVSEQLRALSYIFECPVISATQINRQGANVADPGMELTSESMGLPMTADAAFSIWQDDNDKDLGVINLGMQKSRFGPNFGTTKMRIDYDTFLIDEIEDQFFSSNVTLKEASNSLDKLLENDK